MEEELEDPRQELVRRLLEYKQYRDAASMLEERSRRGSSTIPRLSTDLPRHQRDIRRSEPIQEVELWDLVSAFGRIMRETDASRPSSIVYDDTPIHVYMARIHAPAVGDGPPLASASCSTPSMHKSKLVGIFLAVLELVRHHHVRVRAERRCSARSGSCPIATAPAAGLVECG